MNKKSDLTLVTGLFDIGRGNLQSGFNRKFEQYLECFAKLLKVNYNLVVYVPEELNDFVWQHRSKENTRIINKSVDDLKNKYFPFYNQVQSIRTRPEWINQSGWIVDSTQAKLDMYVPLVMSKQFFLNDASLFNYFNTKYFVWIDAGIANTIGNCEGYLDEQFEERITPHLANKMMYVAFPYQSDAPEVHGFAKPKLNELAGAVTEFVCRGGIFGGQKENINEINDIYYNLMHSTLNAGYMGTEESLFTIIAYKYPTKVNVQMIDANGLVYKFFENLKSQPVQKAKEFPLAFYFLVFNTPDQFEMTLNTWKVNYPEEFKRCKKYVVNNSNDPSVDEKYKKIFAENDMQEFKMENNLGICGGRQWIAEHFDKSDHDYYIFFEEDMGWYNKGEICQSGLTTYHPKLFDKAVDILNDEKLDFLRLTYSEFFGTCEVSWCYINYPGNKKDEYYPPKEGLIASKTYSPNTLNKPKVDYIGVYKGLPYVVGNYHYSNWPILFNKAGNKKMFLDTVWAHLYEQTWMSYSGFLWEDRKLKIGCLLASPVKHQRDHHYDGTKRRENPLYTN